MTSIKLLFKTKKLDKYFESYAKDLDFLDDPEQPIIIDKVRYSTEQVKSQAIWDIIVNKHKKFNVQAMNENVDIPFDNGKDDLEVFAYCFGNNKMFTVSNLYDREDDLVLRVYELESGQ